MLKLTAATKRFNTRTVNEVVALDGLDLAIEAGEFVTIIGSNGAGKSTLLNIVAGLTLLDEGTICLRGVDITRLPDYSRAGWLGRIDQDPKASTCAALSIEENLAIAAMRGRRRLLGRGVTAARRSDFRDLLSRLGLGLERRLGVRVGNLSGGQRQAVGLIMATMGSPDVLLLDEHIAALDPRTAMEVMEITNTIVTEGRLTTLMVTHNMEHALRWGNRLLMMHAGRIVLDFGQAEKQTLTIRDLLDRFAAVSREHLVDDELLLSQALDDLSAPRSH